MSANPTSARMLLREKTADLHVELDGLLSRTDFDDRRSYADFLTRQAAPLFAIEQAMDAAAPTTRFPDWADRARSTAIRRDLAVLGVPIPAPSALATLDTADRMLGALYVLEGSRLGAKFLVRHARASRDPAVREATAYLGHGETAPFWPTFLKALARREEDGLDRDALVDGARKGFAMFLDAAKKPSIEPATGRSQTDRKSG